MLFRGNVPLQYGKINMPLTKHFTRHPASVGETYFGHMAFAVGFSGWLIAAGVAAMIHAFFPFAFEKTASQIIARLYEKTSNRVAE